MEARITQFFERYIQNAYFPEMHMTDIVEILIIAFLVYQIMIWIKNTKAWMLLKGILVLGVFIFVAFLFQMHTILWIARNSMAVLATALIVVFQPELRRALEKLGERKYISVVVPFDRSKDKSRFSEETIDGIIDASYTMGESMTGALIVVEQAIKLTEYESTGIQLDCIVSSQVLVNIFEHNTPLHDGAIIIRNDRIVSATCYLPLSDNMELSKELGTRHRAAVGLSEVSDALVIVVSEETGYVSVAQGGVLDRNVSREKLRDYLEEIQNKRSELRGIRGILAKWKGRLIHEKKSDK